MVRLDDTSKVGVALQKIGDEVEIFSYKEKNKTKQNRDEFQLESEGFFQQME